MLLDELKNYKVYLASKSPRRRELLTDMGIDFEILAAELEGVPAACVSVAARRGLPGAVGGGNHIRH